MKVEIYSKPDCCLCDDAKRVLEDVRARIPFDLVEVDIRTDPARFERYRYDIPVICIDGRRAFKHRLTARQLEDRLSREGLA